MVSPTANRAALMGLPLRFSTVSVQPPVMGLSDAVNGDEPEFHQSLRYNWLVQTGTSTSALKLSPVCTNVPFSDVSPPRDARYSPRNVANFISLYIGYLALAGE